MRQLNAQPLALVRVRGERLAVAVLGRALAHILQAGLVVHGRVHLLVAGVEDLRSQPVAQPVHDTHRSPRYHVITNCHRSIDYLATKREREKERKKNTDRLCVTCDLFVLGNAWLDRNSKPPASA